MKTIFSRESDLNHLRSKGWKVASYKTSSAVVAWKTESSGKTYVKGWRGKADKPAFYYSFRSPEQARQHVTEWESLVAKSEARRAAEKADLAAKAKTFKAADYWAVGDVVYNSWGYEQTNIDWYQVVEVGVKSVKIQAIRENSKETGFMTGICQPRRNDFVKGSKPELKRVSPNGYITAKYGCLSKWDGRAKGWSSYA